MKPAALRDDPVRLAMLVTMVLLAALCVAWETKLAPVRPGAWLLALKALPLLLALPGIARGHLRTVQWWSMIILLYLAEGLVRGASDQGFSALLGWIEAALAGACFGLILMWCRRVRVQAATTA